jgi:hypothetical protein
MQATVTDDFHIFGCTVLKMEGGGPIRIHPRIAKATFLPEKWKG